MYSLPGWGRYSRENVKLKIAKGPVKNLCKGLCEVTKSKFMAV